MRRTRLDPDGLRLPIKLDSTSNGEFVSVPLQPVHRHARRLGQTCRDNSPRRIPVKRRRSKMMESRSSKKRRIKERHPSMIQKHRNAFTATQHRACKSVHNQPF